MKKIVLMIEIIRQEFLLYLLGEIFQKLFDQIREICFFLSSTDKKEMKGEKFDFYLENGKPYFSQKFKKVCLINLRCQSN